MTVTVVPAQWLHSDQRSDPSPQVSTTDPCHPSCPFLEAHLCHEVHQNKAEISVLPQCWQGLSLSESRPIYPGDGLNSCIYSVNVHLLSTIYGLYDGHSEYTGQ